MLIGELASPFVHVVPGKYIVLTNQHTPIQKVSPNLEHEPQFGYMNLHLDAGVSASSPCAAWLFES